MKKFKIKNFKSQIYDFSEINAFIKYNLITI